MIRPKLYVIFSEETEKKILENGNLRKRLEKNLDTLNLQTDIMKYALHGFWGNIIQLLALYKDKNTIYDFKHMTKIRESLSRHKYPRIMEHGIRTIKVDWKKERGLCGVPKEKALHSLEMCNLDCFTCAHNTFAKC
jgi:RNA binding exosome subunit